MTKTVNIANLKSSVKTDIREIGIFQKRIDTFY